MTDDEVQDKEETTTEEETEDGEETTIEEEFKNLFQDASELQKRWMRLAQSKEEEKDPKSANLLRLIAGDVFPLISDLIAASGSAFEEVGAVAEAAEEGPNLTDEELIQIYITLVSNKKAFEQLEEASNDPKIKEGLHRLVVLNTETMEMLKTNFGDELVEAAEEQIKEATVE